MSVGGPLGALDDGADAGAAVELLGVKVIERLILGAVFGMMLSLKEYKSLQRVRYRTVRGVPRQPVFDE